MQRNDKNTQWNFCLFKSAKWQCFKYSNSTSTQVQQSFVLKSTTLSSLLHPCSFQYTFSRCDNFCNENMILQWTNFVSYWAMTRKSKLDCGLFEKCQGNEHVTNFFSILLHTFRNKCALIYLLNSMLIHNSSSWEFRSTQANIYRLQ